MRESQRKMWMGWWGNKPPVHRFLVRLGLFSTIGLISVGLLLDRNVLNLKEVFPSLNPFIWDLAKGAILGTVTIAFLDDVRSWGVAWRVLRTNSASVANAANNLIETLLHGLGLQKSILGTTVGLRSTAVRAKRVHTWLGVLSSADDKYIHDLAMKTLPPAQNPFESRDSFMSVLTNEKLPVPLASDMSHSFTVEAFTKDLTEAALELTAALEKVQQDTSTGVSSRIGNLLGELTKFPAAAASFTRQVRKLVDYKNSQENEPSLSTVGTVSFTMYLLASVLEDLAYEGDTGLPHPFRPSGV